MSDDLLARRCREKENLYIENQKKTNLLAQTVQTLNFCAWRFARLKDESGVCECSNLSQQIEGGRYYNYKDLRAKIEAEDSHV